MIVDTPPSRHAIDLLEAPDRLVGFLSHPVYRTLTVGQRTFAKITDAASSMFLWAVKRLAGPQIVEDTVEFFRSLANIEGGLRQRAKQVSELLRGDDTAFVVVSSPRAEAVGEAEHLLDAIADKKFPLGGLVVNLIHPMPEPLTDDDEDLLAGIDDGPLGDQLEWHRELTSLALPSARNWWISNGSPETPRSSNSRSSMSTSTMFQASSASRNGSSDRTHRSPDSG